jgi:LPS O-antigen subunit length determinant protein (WzzB/FepE family)
VKTDPLSLVYRTIYAIEPEQEKLVFSDVKTLFEANDSSRRRTERTETKRERLVFSPVRTIFEMSDFVKAEEASEGPDQMTQLLLD